MAYTPTKIWTPTEIITAEDMRDNFDGIKNFLNKIPDNALAAGQWVDTNHIMKGFYEPTINCATFVSGITGGKVFHYSGDDFTYATAGNTLKKGTSTPYVNVPKSAIDFEITSPSTILYHYWMCPKTCDNNDGALGRTDVYIWNGNITGTNSQTITRSKEADVVTALFPEWEERYFLSGTRLVTGLSVGTYHMGLSTRSTTAKTKIIAWGYSAEVFCL